MPQCGTGQGAHCVLTATGVTSGHHSGEKWGHWGSQRLGGGAGSHLGWSGHHQAEPPQGVPWGCLSLGQPQWQDACSRLPWLALLCLPWTELLLATCGLPGWPHILSCHPRGWRARPGSRTRQSAGGARHHRERGKALALKGREGNLPEDGPRSKVGATNGTSGFQGFLYCTPSASSRKKPAATLM